jgi:ABC-2 type transport system ATP-binding protein
MRKEQTSHKNEHNTLMCFPLEPVFTRDKRRLPNFMDEPTAGLDVGAREAMLDILREYMEEEPERSILISSHISSDLEHLCDDIYVIHKGKIVLHEEMDTILEKYAVLKVSEAQYQAVDKSYILKEKKENFGISCLTNEKQYYIENYPEIVVESGSLDQVILMLTGGER